MVVVDNDKPLSADIVRAFTGAGGKVIQWRAGRALEDELFSSFPREVVSLLLERAKGLRGANLVDHHIKSKSEGRVSLADIEREGAQGDYSESTRVLLGAASRAKKNAWFKSVSKMEGVAHDIVGPNLAAAEAGLKALVDELFGWARGEA